MTMTWAQRAASGREEDPDQSTSVGEQGWPSITATLLRVRGKQMAKMMAATMILKTWRVWKERQLALANKKSNNEGTKPKYHEHFREEKKDNGKNVSISPTVLARDADGMEVSEDLSHHDSRTRSSYNFAILAKSWSTILLKRDFFEKQTTIKLLKNISDEEMDLFIDEAIEALKGGMIRLWGHTGGHVKFYNANLWIFEDLKEAWDKEKAKKSVPKLQPIKKFKFNPEAVEFKPKTIESSLDELNTKMELLLKNRTDYPVCIATPL